LPRSLNAIELPGYQKLVGDAQAAIEFERSNKGG